jgi:hypothetical protein
VWVLFAGFCIDRIGTARHHAAANEENCMADTTPHARNGCIALSFFLRPNKFFDTL